MKLFISFIVIASFVTVNADILYLKTGEELYGTFVESNAKGIVFENERGIEQYPSSKVQKLDLGYTGVSYCLVFTNKKKYCEGLLVQVSDTGIKLAKGKGFREQEFIPFKKIFRLEVKKNKKNERLIGVFSEGLPVEIEVGGNKMQGKIETYNRREKTLGFQSGNRLDLISEEEIDSVVWQKKPGILDYSIVGLELVIPGIYEFKSNRWLGVGMGLAFITLSTVASMQYRAAQEALATNVDYIPVGRDIWIVSGLDSNPLYEQSIQNFYGAVAGLGAVYGFHGFSIARDYKSGIFPEWRQMELGTNGIGFHPNHGMSSNLEFKFSHSF